MSRIQIEVDSRLLKNGLESNAFDQAPCDMMLSDIRNFCLGIFIVSKISLVPRSINSSAHEHASLGLAWEPGQFQM